MAIFRIGETQAKWDRIASHQASVKNIPPEMLGEIRPLLASPPKGGYFEKLDQS